MVAVSAPRFLRRWIMNLERLESCGNYKSPDYDRGRDTKSLADQGDRFPSTAGSNFGCTIAPFSLTESEGGGGD